MTHGKLDLAAQVRHNRDLIDEDDLFSEKYNKACMKMKK